MKNCCVSLAWLKVLFFLREADVFSGKLGVFSDVERLGVFFFDIILGVFNALKHLNFLRKRLVAVSQAHKIQTTIHVFQLNCLVKIQLDIFDFLFKNNFPV